MQHSVQVESDLYGAKPYPVGRVLDFSGSIVAGGVAQAIFDPPVRGFEIVNVDPAEDLWIADGGQTPAANAAGSIRIAPNGGAYATPTNMAPQWQQVQVFAATTGHKYTARYW